MENVLIIKNEAGHAVAYETPYSEDDYATKWRKSFSPFIDGLRVVVYMVNESNLYFVYQDRIEAIKAWEWSNQGNTVFFIVQFND